MLCVNTTGLLIPSRKTRCEEVRKVRILRGVPLLTTNSLNRLIGVIIKVSPFSLGLVFDTFFQAHFFQSEQIKVMRGQIKV